MAVQTSRYHDFKLKTQVASVTLQTDNTSPEIKFEEFVSGTIFIVDAGITTLTYYATPRSSDEPDPLVPAGNTQTTQTWYPLFTSVPTPVAVTQTVSQNNAYDLPAACQGCGSIQIRANASGKVEISKKS